MPDGMFLHFFCSFNYNLTQNLKFSWQWLLKLWPRKMLGHVIRRIQCCQTHDVGCEKWFCIAQTLCVNVLFLFWKKRQWIFWKSLQNKYLIKLIKWFNLKSEEWLKKLWNLHDSIIVCSTDIISQNFSGFTCHLIQINVFELHVSSALQIWSLHSGNCYRYIYMTPKVRTALRSRVVCSVQGSRIHVSS